MKKLGSIFFYFILLFYLEAVLKQFLFSNIFSLNTIYMIVFIIPIALLFRLLSGLLKCKIVNSLIVISITIIYIAQLIYYKTYLSIFSVYSMTKAEQLVDYIDTIIKIIYRNSLAIIIMILPVILFFVFYKKIFKHDKDEFKITIIFLLSLVLFQVLGVLILNTSKNEMYSPKQLYYDIHSPILSTSKLGLLTTMRLDLKRLIFGFEEKSRLEDPKPIDQEPIIEDEIEIEYNRLEIDFDKLIVGESNQIIKNMHIYFRDSQATTKNEYTGMFKGKNLIVLLAESFDPIAVDKDITPTLYKLYNEGFKFTNFYTPLFPVSTSDGEYITVTSLIPKEGVWSSKRSSNNYFPFVLGNSFKKIGYKTTAYHNHTATYYNRDLSHPNFGYDYYACGRGLNINCKQWPESDLEMIETTYKAYSKTEPYLTYYITVSGHLRYTRIGNMMAYKNWSYVKDLKYSDSIKAYMSCHIELDKALAKLIEYLEESNQLANTVIALSSDHYPYGLTLDEINEKSTYERDDLFEKHRNHFLVWNSQTEPIIIDKLGSSLDVLPTLLNLFGIDYDSRLLMGKDLLSDSEPIVIYSDRSFITEKGYYNSITSTFKSNNNEAVDQAYLDKFKKIVYDKFYLSRQILDNNYYKLLFK